MCCVALRSWAKKLCYVFRCLASGIVWYVSWYIVIFIALHCFWRCTLYRGFDAMYHGVLRPCVGYEVYEVLCLENVSLFLGVSVYVCVEGSVFCITM